VRTRPKLESGRPKSQLGVSSGRAQPHLLVSPILSAYNPQTSRQMRRQEQLCRCLKELPRYLPQKSLCSLLRHGKSTLRALKTEPQAFGSSFSEMAQSPGETWQRRLQDVIDRKSHLLFARLRGKLVGMVGAFQQEEDRQSSTANIYGMYVDSEARFQGVGKMLLSRLLQNLAESGVKRARLDVNTDQLAAKQLYLSLGFAVTGSKIQTLGDGRQHLELGMELLIHSGARRRIHIFGASGAGTTTLGRALSKRLSIDHFDSDDYFWVKTPVPYTEKSDVAKRVELLRSDLFASREWVLSGSLCEWGDFAIPLFTLAVFLWIPAELRMKRLRGREISRYGEEALSPGGWFYQNHLDFMAYAASYDLGGLDVRSRKLHEQWMSKLPCRLLRIEVPMSIDDLCAGVEQQLGLGDG
jgi:adenylate kinase family enzyme/ribosomal protein S18 acetylase RimI-like enzyme